MASYPYAYPMRSTTPPLYYHRPESNAPSYYAVPAREVESLRIPAHGDAARGAAVIPPPTATATAPTYPRASVSLHPSTERNSTQRPAPPPPSPRLSGYAMPAVVYPYAVPTHPLLATSTSAGRRSDQPPQPYPPVDVLASRTAAIDAEESAMAAEEAALRARLAELQAARKHQEDEQLYLSHGWAQMLEKEERYYTEPVIDRRPDIMAREQQCAVLHERLQQAEAQAQHTQAQLQSTEYILRDAESFEQERQRVQDGFQDMERRRRECVAKAERYFDVEARRAVEGNKVMRKLDGELRDMTRRGPLAQQPSHTRTTSTQVPSSRMVTFAPDKSIVLDLGREESAEPPMAESGGGLTSSYASALHSPSTMDTFMTNEEDIGGSSVAFSLNDAKAPLLSKRRKTEAVAV